MQTRGKHKEVWHGVAVHAPVETVSQLLPVRLLEDGVSFTSRSAPTETPYLGSLRSWRRVGRWSVGDARGEAHLEVVAQVDDRSSELVVRVAPPRGLRGIFWSRRRLALVASVLADAARRNFAPVERRVPVERTTERRIAGRRHASAS